MEQQPFFADVDLPFHVWVREGRRWVLRDYVASLTPQSLVRLPDSCRGLRVKAEEDVEYWTCRLSQRVRADDALVDEDLRQEVFHHFLHASLRISQIHRAKAVAPARALDG